jgi:uncharacterized protein (TIGR02001 family)
MPTRSRHRPQVLPALHAALLSGLVGAGARAEPIELSFGVASATVLRGVALGAGGVDVHAGAHYADPSGWRATLGATALHSKASSRSRWQTQWFGRLGYAHRLDDDWSAQLAYAHYAYPGSQRLRRYGHDEVGATLAYRDLLYLSVAGLRRTHAGSGGNRDSVACDVVVRHALTAPLSAHAGVGRLATRGDASYAYTYGHLGLGAQWGATQAQLTYIATGAAAKQRFGDAASNRWSASLGWSF